MFKTRISVSNCFCFMLLFAAVLHGATHVGSDTTTKSNWRTSAALEEDNEYGSDGYIIYGLNVVDGRYIRDYNTSKTHAENVVSLPGYISEIVTPSINMWSGNGNFGKIENPANGNALENTSLLAGVDDGHVYTINRAEDVSFRLTVMVSDGDGAKVDWTTKVNDGSQVTSVLSSPVTETTFYEVFDIAAGDGPVTVTLSANNNFSVTGFAFDLGSEPFGVVSDPIPESGKTNVLPATTLRWTPSPDAVSQKVYFGTVSGAIPLIASVDADRAFLAPVPFPLKLESEYFWRVDTVAGSETVTGKEWSFSTRAPGNCDINADGAVDSVDASIVAGYWLDDDCGADNLWCGGADLNYSGIVDMFDFSLFANEWGNETGTEIIYDFETGDLQGWRVVEGGFGMFVCDRGTYHNGGATYNKQGTYFLSSLETESYTPTDAYMGTAESPVFRLTEPEVSFLVGGGSGATYIAICTVDDDLNEQEVKFARGANTETMLRIDWNLGDLVGKKVFIRLADQSTGGWGHVTFDDFSATGVIDNELTARRWANAPLPIDISAAVIVVEDLMETYPAEEYAGQEYLDQLDAYEVQLRDLLIAIEQGSGTQGQLDALVAEVQAFIREVMLANPMVSGQEILFITRDQYPGDHHNTHTFFPSYDGEMNNGYFRTGGAMKKIDFATGGTVTTLIETPNGIVRDPDVHFDGGKIVFAKRDNTAGNFNIFEINTDGTGLVQLTKATRVSDLDPIYMQDDSVVFSSTREPKYVHCNRHIMCNLYKMDFDGANIHQISNNTLFDMQCSLMDDGRIMYSRWEYVDRNFGDAQSVWTSHPDGNNHAVYFGNNTISPGAVIDPRQIPGTQQMVGIFSSCHDRPWGALAVVDRRLGVDLPQPGKANPVKYLWPESSISVMGGWDGNTPIPLNYGGQYGFDNTTNISPKYEDPYPLYDPEYPDSTGKYFLVSRMTGSGEKMGIYLVDIFGNEILLHEESSGRGCYDPMPIRTRERPPQLPTLRKFTEDTKGKFYVSDVYQGTHMGGVERGAVKSLRVLEATEKRAWTYNGWSGQGFEGPGMAWHDFYSKKILGTVPVEEDGSAYFEVPSETFMYFQLLDEDGKMIQSMRSGTLVQPGEMLGCVGCHESRTDAYPVAEDHSYLPAAIQREPDQMNGWYGQTKNYNFLDDVQPVFTDNCVSCHGFDTAGGAKGGLLLEPDKTLYFNTSYNELWRKGMVGVVGAGKAPIEQAYSWGSHVSRLVKSLDDADHTSVSLTVEERDRIITWIDLNAPYYPEYTSAYPGNSAGRSPLSGSQISTLGSLTGKNFGQKAPPYVSFDRPEKSICLKGLSGSAYSQALAIIQAGADNLANKPRADMAGHQGNSVDQSRKQKYDMRKGIEMLNRQAIREGWLNYDE